VNVYRTSPLTPTIRSRTINAAPPLSLFVAVPVVASFGGFTLLLRDHSGIRPLDVVFAVAMSAVATLLIGHARRSRHVVGLVADPFAGTLEISRSFAGRTVDVERVPLAKPWRMTYMTAEKPDVLRKEEDPEHATMSWLGIIHDDVPIKLIPLPDSAHERRTILEQVDAFLRELDHALSLASLARADQPFSRGFPSP
jgi:hypothetical protein